MKFGKITLTLLFLLVVSLTPALYSQEVFVEDNYKYLFVCNEEGQILWKKAFSKGFHGYSWNEPYLVVNCLNRIVAFDIHSGKKLWEKSFEKGVRGLGFSRDTLLVTVGKDIHFLRAANGSLVGKKTLKEYNSRYDIALFLMKCGYRRHFRPEIKIVRTSKYFIGYSPELKILWKIPPSDYRYLGYSFDLAFFSSEDSVRVLDKRKGTLLWKRGFPEKIEYVVLGSRTEVHLKSGAIFLFDSKTGRLLKKKRSKNH